jgi:hypothetical protein
MYEDNKRPGPQNFKAIPVFVCIGGLVVVEHQFMFLIIGDGLVLRLACLTATTNHASQQQQHHLCLHPKPCLKHLWCNFRISKKIIEALLYQAQPEIIRY